MISSLAHLSVHLASNFTTKSFVVASRVTIPLTSSVRGFRSTSLCAKLKTHSGTKKRFRLGGNSKAVNVKMSQAGRRHLAQPNNRKKLRDQGQTVYVQGAQRKRILRMLCKK